MSDPIADDAPRHLHVATIFEDSLRRSPQFLLGVPTFVGIRTGDTLFTLGVAGAVLVVTLFFNWMRWLRFTYHVGDDELVIERGLLQRSRRSIPLERIQDVSIERKLLARLLGVATVRIETGGGDKDEGLLDSVGVAEAERLRATLRDAQARAPMAVAEDQAAPAPQEEPLYEMPLQRLMLSGLFGFSLVWLAAIFGGLQFAQQTLNIGWEEIVRWLGVAERQAQERFSIATVLVALLIAALLGFFSGVARAVARNYQFRLSHGEGRFRRTRGLFTRSEVVVADRRIQLALVGRGMIAGRLGYGELFFQTLGGSDDASGLQEMAPFARDEEISAVIDAAGLPRFEPQALRPVSPGHVVRAAIRHAGVPLVAMLLASIWLPPVLFALPALAVPIGLALLRRRYHRYALLDSSFQMTRGVLSRSEWTVPYDTIQAVQVSQTLLQRVLGIATVTVDTAGARGGTPRVQDVEASDAMALATGALARVV